VIGSSSSRISVLCFCDLGSERKTVVIIEGGYWLIVVSYYIFTTVLSSFGLLDLWSCFSSYLGSSVFRWAIFSIIFYCQHLNHIYLLLQSAFSLLANQDILYNPSILTVFYYLSVIIILGESP